MNVPAFELPTTQQTDTRAGVVLVEVDCMHGEDGRIFPFELEADHSVQLFESIKRTISK